MTLYNQCDDLVAECLESIGIFHYKLLFPRYGINFFLLER